MIPSGTARQASIPTAPLYRAPEHLSAPAGTRAQCSTANLNARSESMSSKSLFPRGARVRWAPEFLASMPAEIRASESARGTVHAESCVHGRTMFYVVWGDAPVRDGAWALPEMLEEVCDIDERKDRRRRRCGTCGRRLTTAQEKSDGYCERCREDAIDHGALSGEVR